MLLGDQDVKEFRTIYEEEFGEAISEQEAGIMASRLVGLYEALARPLLSERADFTDSTDHAKLDVEVGISDSLPASEKVAL